MLLLRYFYPQSEQYDTDPQRFVEFGWARFEFRCFRVVGCVGSIAEGARAEFFWDTVVMVGAKGRCQRFEATGSAGQ